VKIQRMRPPSGSKGGVAGACFGVRGRGGGGGGGAKARKKTATPESLPP